jgi:hypothetical protein
VEGDSLTLNRSTAAGVPPVTNLNAWRTLCRRLAEDRAGGIVSGEPFENAPRPVYQFIYKREDGPGYLYGGQVFILDQGCVWVIGGSTREHGPTGVREAMVTAQLAEQGHLVSDGSSGPGALATGEPYRTGSKTRMTRTIKDGSSEAWRTERNTTPSFRITLFLDYAEPWAAFGGP